MLLLLYTPLVAWASLLVALFIFGMLWCIFWFSHHGTGDGSFYFDAQDYFAADPQAREFPLSAKTSTFESILKNYIGVTQLLVTIAAASIAFGGSQTLVTPIVFAKLILAWSIVYGVFFCAFLLWRYDEY